MLQADRFHHKRHHYPAFVLFYAFYDGCGYLLRSEIGNHFGNFGHTFAAAGIVLPVFRIDADEIARQVLDKLTGD